MRFAKLAPRSRRRALTIMASVVFVVYLAPISATALAREPVLVAMSLFSQDEPPPPRSKLKDPQPLAPPPNPSSGALPSTPVSPPSVATSPAPPPPTVPGAVTPVPSVPAPMPAAPAPDPGAVPPPAPGLPAAVRPMTPGPPPLTSPATATNGHIPNGHIPAGDLNGTLSVDGYSYDPKSRRDPFQSMAKLLKASQNRAELPPLQRVELSDVKLIGIISDHSGYYGLIQTPDGKGYTVRVGTLMGTNNGTIKTISEQKIIVAEPTLDVMGKMTTREIEILQRPKEGTE